MSIRELFKPMHPNARPRNGILSRLGGALARPFQTSYVCPSLMTVTAVAYALRGYEPYWTPVSAPDPHYGRHPSSVCYRIYKSTDDGRYPSHGVALRCIFPDRAIRAECDLRNALGRFRARLASQLELASSGGAP